jgi:hypothetical protein
MIVLPTVVIGGVSILSLLISDPTYMENSLRQDMWRAGQAHAGMWLILALVALRYVDEANLSNIMKWLVRGSIPIAAILVPAVLSPDATARTGSSFSPMSAQCCWPSACSYSASASSGVRHNDPERCVVRPRASYDRKRSLAHAPSLRIRSYEPRMVPSALPRRSSRPLAGKAAAGHPQGRMGAPHYPPFCGPCLNGSS